jgi:hypothetical protein
VISRARARRGRGLGSEEDLTSTGLGRVGAAVLWLWLWLASATGAAKQLRSAVWAAGDRRQTIFFFAVPVASHTPTPTPSVPPAAHYSLPLRIVGICLFFAGPARRRRRPDSALPLEKLA